MKLRQRTNTLSIILKVVTTLCLTASVIFVAVLLQTRPVVAQQDPRGTATERLMRDRFFPLRLVWVGTEPPREEESQLLWETLERWKASGSSAAVGDVEVFVATLTNSPWTPALHANLGWHFRNRGQMTRALDHWLAAWEVTKDFSDGSRKKVGDFAIANLTRLLMALGRTDELSAIYQTWGSRVLDGGPLTQMWLRTHEKHLRMLAFPQDSYKCGIYALNRVGHALGLSYRRAELLNTQSKPSGFALQELQEISQRFGLGLVAVRRSDTNGHIVVPSVVHWRQEHYAAIIGQRGDLYQVADPSGLGGALAHRRRNQRRGKRLFHDSA